MAARVISLTARGLLAAVFGVAGLLKVWQFPHLAWASPQFADDLLHYRLLPREDVAVVLAIYLPWLEMAAAAALFGRWRLGSLALITGMLLVFTGALGSALWRGIDLTCGCFGHGFRISARSEIVGDLGLLPLAGTALALEWRRAAAARATGLVPAR